MPFTLAHPAIVVPLGGRFPRAFTLPALVAGSMSPDFEYFLRLNTVRTIGHDLAGIPLFCVPASLIALWLFDRAMKGPLIALAPAPIRLRLLPFAAPSLRWWGLPLAILAASAAIGAASHILWDAFTHENGWFVDRIPSLAVPTPMGVKVYKVLQHASTLIGLAALAIWTAACLAKLPPSEEHRSRLSPTLRAGIICAIFVASASFGGAVCLATYPQAIAHGFYGPFVRFAVASLTATAVLALAYSLAFQFYFFRGQHGVTSS